MPDFLTFYAKKAVGWWEHIFPKADKITWLEQTTLQAHHAQGSRIASPEKDAEVLGIVQQVCQKIGESPPKVIIYRSDKPNAIHLDNGTLAIADSKLAEASPDSLKATIAHEMGHHQQRFKTLGVALIRGAAMVAAATFATHKLKPTLEKTGNLAVAAITAVFSLTAAAVHLISEIPYAAYRRWQELDADATSVKVTGSADGIVGNLEASTLRKKQARENGALLQHSSSSNFSKGWKELTRQHPSHEERIVHARKVEATLKSTPGLS
jgi:Zn-dependent protease with chaperone function